MFGISGEHLMILGVIVLFFGPKRLPELGKGLGESIRNFKVSITGEQKKSEGA
ncbi:twin-arginine translocase TatA/TatE family subunit [bacterium]|nr:twin-arginine translocase TatA/TatE family subunit [bacterium]